MSLEDILQNLRNEYLAAMPERLLLIEQQCINGDQIGLRDSFHKLKGTGKTYGIPEISIAAEITELLCTERGSLDLCQRAAKHSIAIIKSVVAARGSGHTYSIEDDPHMIELRKLLPNS